MFLHIGSSRIVFHRDIIGIFDLNLKENPINRQFLESFRETRFLEANEYKKYKSFVVTEEKVKLSPISPMTLARRKGNYSL